MVYLARLLPVLVLIALAGCTERDGEPERLPASHRYTDDLGRTVDVVQPVERVLSLAPNLTEVLFEAGGGALLAGASPADTYPPGLDSLPHFGTYPLDAEAVVALRPDLVLGTDQVNNPADADALAEAGIPTYFFRFTEIGDVPRALRTVGALLGTSAQADSAASDFEARMRHVEARTEGRDRPRVLLLIGDGPLFAFGDASYTQRLLEIAGGESVTAGFAGEAVTLSEEFVLEAAPEVIVVALGPDYDPAQLAALHPAWGSVPAVRTGRVHGIDPDLLVRPGPRLADGAETLARLFGDDETTRQGSEAWGGADVARHVPTDSSALPLFRSSTPQR